MQAILILHTALAETCMCCFSLHACRPRSWLATSKSKSRLALLLPGVFDGAADLLPTLNLLLPMLGRPLGNPSPDSLEVNLRGLAWIYRHSSMATRQTTFGMPEDDQHWPLQGGLDMLKVALYQGRLQSTAAGNVGASGCPHVDVLDSVLAQGMRRGHAAKLGVRPCRFQAARKLRAAGPCPCSSLESPLQGDLQC